MLCSNAGGVEMAVNWCIRANSRVVKVIVPLHMTTQAKRHWLELKHVVAKVCSGAAGDLAPKREQEVVNGSGLRSGGCGYKVYGRRA